MGNRNKHKKKGVIDIFRPAGLKKGMGSSMAMATSSSFFTCTVLFLIAQYNALY
jgi:hypothetical protein